jgi:hypothetical protein
MQASYDIIDALGGWLHERMSGGSMHVRGAINSVAVRMKGCHPGMPRELDTVEGSLWRQRRCRHGRARE